MTRSRFTDNSNVARYCRPRDLREIDKLPAFSAFLLREKKKERYLSVNWLEYFAEDDVAVRINKIWNVLRCKLTLQPKSKLAVLNVGDIKNIICKEVRYTPQVKRRPSRKDKSHVAIFVQREFMTRTAEVLAEYARNNSQNIYELDQK